MENIIFNRHSVRAYQEKEIESYKIERLMQAAMAAPSACNQQPWEFYIVSQKEVLKALSRCSPYAKPVQNAPLAIVPCFSLKDLRAPEFCVQDMSAAVENILLEAVELDLGAVWLGIMPVEKRIRRVQEVLDLKNGEIPFAIVSLGYPSQTESYEKEHRYCKQRIHYIT